LKKVYIFLLLIFISINFSACSSKEAEVPKKQELAQSYDEDFEDFEEELEAEEVYDPFEGYNRAMTSFNDGLYENVFKPVNKGYEAITSVGVRKSINRFFKNLYFPMRFLNNVLQGKFHNAFEETGRFVVNTTAGVLGFFDPAKEKMGLMPHNEDFGQTLGFYGVGPGPHIVIPVFGPSNMRDAISFFPDAAVSPFDYKDRDWPTVTDTWAELLAAKTAEKFNEMSLNAKQYEEIKKDAIDLYPYLRDIYEQKRRREIEE
jgi:phospholipid-binding lipoprotein MlaA